MISIIITRDLSNSEKEALKKYSSNDEYLIFSIASEFQAYPNEQCLSNDINAHAGKACLDEIVQFGQKELNGKTINQWLQHEDKSYWHYLRFSSYFHYLPILKEKNFIHHVIDSRPTDSFIIYSRNQHKFEQEIIWNLPSQSSTPLLRKIKNLILFCIIFLTRATIGFFQFLFLGKNKHVLALEPYVLEDILDIENPASRIRGDYYNEYLSRAMLKEKDFIFLSDFYVPKLHEKLTIQWSYFFNRYTTKSIYFEFYFALRLFDPTLWFSMLQCRSLYNAFNTSSQSDLHPVIQFIRRKKNLICLMHMREIVAAGFFNWKKIKSFTCHHEHSYHHLSLINGAKKIGLHTIGFQHGTIHSEHIHYMFSKEDIKYDPLPKSMITWGPHWKDVLHQHSIYEASKIASLGQIRTDIIPVLKKSMVNIEPPIDLSRKTIVLASQTDQIGVERRKMIGKDFLTLSKTFPQLNFIIKPHPREKNPISYYRAIAKSLGTTNFVISQDDLYLVLNSADALITYHSTVAGEAVYFKKPVILLNYENNDRDNYMEYKGAFQEVKDYAQLEMAIERIATNNYESDERTQEKFIERFSQSIDGSVSQSYIEYIRKISIQQ